MNLEESIGGRLDKIHAEIARQAAHLAEREKVRGIKPVRLPLLRGTPAAGALTLGGDVNTAAGQTPVGPDLGYVWSIRHLVIQGLTAGATPDTMNIVRNNLTVWQLNGNQFAQTWGRGEILLHAGETLQYVSVGTIAATGQVIVHGMAEEVPAEMIGKFY